MHLMSFHTPAMELGLENGLLRACSLEEKKKPSEKVSNGIWLAAPNATSHRLVRKK